jgi:HPt (histidine-containing phosphotransfer) domain-containing protein
MLPVYDEEMNNLKSNLSQLKKSSSSVMAKEINDIAQPAEVKFVQDYRKIRLTCGARLFVNRKETVDTVAAELQNLQALVLNRDSIKSIGAMVEFECSKPVTMLVGFFLDEQNKYARAPKLEVDASANDYGQAEPLIRNAIRINDMPMVNIHAYHFEAGHHKISLPKGILVIAGFTTSQISPRDAGLNGGAEEVDWLFYK